MNYYEALFDFLMDRHSEQIESWIMEDTDAICNYVEKVIRRRWPEAESVIMRDGHAAYRYARYILGARWPEAEPYIRQDGERWAEYCVHFDISEDELEGGI